MKPIPRLIVAASESDADLLHATGFFAPDPFIFLGETGRRSVVLNDLEIDRGRRDARVDEVISFTALGEKLPKARRQSLPDVCIELLRRRKIRAVEVPGSFPLGLARRLERAGIRVRPVEGPFWPDRETKSREAVEKVRRGVRIAEKGMARAYEVLRASTVARGLLRWGGGALTSERLRAEIDCAVLRAGGLPAGTIVAGGDQACDPHERGSGPLRADSLIILDIFPRDAKSGYFGDLTRTVVRGRASEEQRKLWGTVREAQATAIRSMKPGESGRAIDGAIRDFFVRRGYPTEVKGGRQTGFFHGTGHGLGLEIHETPRFARATLEVGHVLTVEPGLYYPGLGGVRIEDVVAVVPGGVERLSRIAKVLEI
jgi:Xaa-Pro aminopeptidase